MNKLNPFIILLSLLIIGACSSGPELLEAERSSEAESLFKPEGKEAINSQANASHTVQLVDSLQASRYTYYKVEEGDKEFWIATMKSSFPLNEAYVFDKGLYKTNYYSTEFDRNFDEIYLVSDLRPKQSHSSRAGNTLNQIVRFETNHPVKKHQSDTSLDREGSIKIRELISNASDYIGQEVQITAKVTKINPNIMDRNWLHLQDGSFDSFDMVATSLEAVPAGHIVTLKAKFAKDKDFGAGYSYDFILENAQLVK